MEMLGKYQLLKKIAVGGMAEIWVATTTASGVSRVCVVKRILPHLAQMPDFVSMFLDEARIVASLTHPNLVQLLDVGEEGGVPFLAMEYLHGADVRSIKRALRSRDEARLPLTHALHIAIGTAAGLHSAHDLVGLDGRPRAIVHRDVSPQNIFVTYDGGVKVLDFGIAKSADRSVETRTGTLKGKIPYMSPEQCACEPLDRRSDIYSIGVVLYELTTGHRVHATGASEYEMMRAIVEGTVPPPSQVDPGFPAALEAIVLKCLQKDRNRRYATARALQADLEAFAREERMAISSIALSSYMAELFGRRAEAWRDALARGGADLAQLAVGDREAGAPRTDQAAADRPTMAKAYGALLEGRQRLTTRPPGVTAPAGPAASAPPETPPASGATPETGADLAVSQRRVGAVQVLSLSGRLNERFQGAALAPALAGRVVVDLAGVTRVTSFGVREWLQMLAEAAPRAPALYLARCSEPVVNQLSMIKGFAGEGRVVSFAGPYRCEACGHGFSRLLDVERDAAALRALSPPDAPCPRCGAEAVFDDDAQSYLAFAAAHLGEPVPADVRAALDELGRAAPAEPIEKTIDGRVTRVGVRAPLDAALRWKRVLDGLEGDLEIELGEVPGVTPEGAAAFENALRALGPEVEHTRLQGCPRALAERLLAARPPLRVELSSFVLEGRCAACNALRAGRVTLAETRQALREGHDPYAPCKRCNTPLDFSASRAFLRLLAPEEAGESPPPPEARVSAAPPSTPSNTASAQVTAPRAGRTSTATLAVAFALAGGLAAFLLVPRLRAPSPAPSGSSLAPAAPGSSGGPAVGSSGGAAAVGSSGAPARSGGMAASPEDPPAWAAQPFTREGDLVYVVGRGAGATEEVAFAAAREDALDRLATRSLDELAGKPLGDFVKPRLPRDEGARRAESLAPAAARWLRQVGAVATPERADAWTARRGGRVESQVRYRLSKGGWESATAFYGKTATLAGMTVAPVHPLLERALRTTGDLIVVAVAPGSPAARAGVREGDVVLAVEGRTVSRVDDLPAAGPAQVRLEEGGAARVVRIGP